MRTWQVTPLALALTAITAHGTAAQNGSQLEPTDRDVAEHAHAGHDHEDALVVEHVVVRGAYFGQHAASAVKTPTLLVNVPQSVSVMTAEQFQNQAMTSVTEVLQYSPGVSLGQGEDHRDQITIRGQNTTADFFLDGVRDDVQYFRPLYNLERVEILRGSNALLFGRGGGGGVINRVSKSAETDANFTEVSAGMDSFGASVVSADSNLVINSQQALRVNAMAETLENHRDFKDGDRWAINPTYTVNLSGRTVVQASWEIIDDRRVVDRGNPAVGGAPLRGFDETFFGDTERNLTRFDANIFRLRADHQFSSGWSGNATLQFADYDKLYQNLYPVGIDIDADTVTLDGYSDATDRDNAILQVNLVGHFDALGVEHTLLAGFEYGQQETRNERRDSFFFDSQDDQISFSFTDPLKVPAWTLTDPVRSTNSDVTFTSVFFQDEVTLNDQWIVVAGARLDRFEIDVIDRIEIADGASDGNNGFLASTDTEVSPRVGLIYKPSADLSFYASLSKSFLPRSGDQFLSLTPSSASLAPEEFENREIGFKWNLSNTTSFAASAFEIERENGTAVDPTNPERSVLTGTETRGIELEINGDLNDWASVNASYTWLDGEEMGRFVNGSAANRTLAQLPEHKLALWGNVTLSAQWRAGIGVVHQTEQYASLSNAVALPDFTRVDVAAFWDVSDELEVQLNIENLFDETYFPAAHNDNNITVGRPLNARLSARYRL